MAVRVKTLALLKRNLSTISVQGTCRTNLYKSVHFLWFFFLISLLDFQQSTYSSETSLQSDRFIVKSYAMELNSPKATCHNSSTLSKSLTAFPQLFKQSFQGWLLQIFNFQCGNFMQYIRFDLGPNQFYRV